MAMMMKQVLFVRVLIICGDAQPADGLAFRLRYVYLAELVVDVYFTFLPTLPDVDHDRFRIGVSTTETYLTITGTFQFDQAGEAFTLELADNTRQDFIGQFNNLNIPGFHLASTALQQGRFNYVTRNLEIDIGDPGYPLVLPFWNFPPALG
ncbi:hypothetical protein FOL47_011348 [Perkinsus chesapeaki]|uniref:Uncharacterized protein n=1 Tax=Perkinsus chesapeaki TaxID=330153 RepID=A0A7J6KZA4_PERCH|nr:hypothetical protein FOL47_011348 [Perkinsus chesapeaki]